MRSSYCGNTSRVRDKEVFVTSGGTVHGSHTDQYAAARFSVKSDKVSAVVSKFVGLKSKLPQDASIRISFRTEIDPDRDDSKLFVVAAVDYRRGEEEHAKFKGIVRELATELLAHSKTLSNNDVAAIRPLHRGPTGPHGPAAA